MPIERDFVDIDFTRFAGLKNAYTEVFFVSPDGSNSDGTSWDRAFTTIPAALDAVSTDLNDMALIVLAPNHPSGPTTGYDINTTGDPNWDVNFDLLSSNRHSVRIVNNHVNATSILKFTRNTDLYNVKFGCGTGSNDGVVISGSNARGVKLSNVWIGSSQVTGANHGIRVENTVNVGFDNVWVKGTAGFTTGLYLNNSDLSYIRNMQIYNCLIGTQILTGSDDNYFSDTTLNGCATGLQIDATATDCSFEHLDVIASTTNITDNGTNTNFMNLHSDVENAAIVPTDLTGVAVTAGVGADTWGTAATIRTAVAATKPFYATGIVIEPDTAEKWGLRFSDDGGTTYFWDSVVEQWTGNESRNIEFASPFLIRQGSAITAQAKSETGGNVIDVWIQIVNI